MVEMFYIIIAGQLVHTLCCGQTLVLKQQIRGLSRVHHCGEQCVVAVLDRSMHVIPILLALCFMLSSPTDFM